MDIDELFSSTWKIAWKHKALWGFGFLSIAIAFLILPLMFVPMLSLFASLPYERLPDWFENPVYLVGWLALFMVLTLASFLISPWMRAALTLGAYRAKQGAERLNFGEILAASRTYYLRLLGLMALYTGSIFLFFTVLSLVEIVAGVLTMGLASMCLAPLSFLMYPLMYFVLAWMELAEASIVVRGMGVIESVRHSWQLMRGNTLQVVLLTLILYLGIGMITSVFIIPMMLPFMAAPFSIITEGEMPRTIFIASTFCLVLYFPIFAFLQGGILAFIKSGWVVGYLQLTRKTEEASLIQANA